MDPLVLAVILSVPALLFIAWLAFLNRARDRQDRREALAHEPISGPEFCRRFFPDYPAATVLGVRRRFAAAAGVAADDVLPDDSFVSLGASNAARVEEFIADFALARADSASAAALVSGELRTLEDFIRTQVLLERVK